LRTRCRRPRCDRAAEERDERAACYHEEFPSTRLLEN